MSDADSLRINYALGLDDLLAVAERSINQSFTPSVTRTWMALVTLNGGVAALIALVLLGPSKWQIAIGLGAFAGLFWYVALPPRGARQRTLTKLRKRLGEPANACMVGPRRFDLDAQGFAIGADNFDLRYRWSCLQRIVVTPKRLFLYVSGMQAHALPLTADKAGEVLQWVRQHAPLVPIAE